MNNGYFITIADNLNSMSPLLIISMAEVVSYLEPGIDV